MYISII